MPIGFFSNEHMLYYEPVDGISNNVVCATG